ncbi:MAG: CoA transferase [SAR202 cluster bacterium Io17-Chloro-G9]|nr:MAG: CoA transferase [SAR202 cluster bacterium Io17-Chloro-G9]
MAATPKALAGIRVVDFTWVRAGPWATRWLGALGAEVIKVEWPLNERGRSTGTAPPGVPSTLNTSTNFNDTNANKKGITVNLRTERGLDLIKRLISVSDVVVENFSSRALQSWGLGYDELRKLKPDIVYVSQSGFGHTGRHSGYLTMGPIAQAFSGMTFLSGLPGEPPAGWGWSYLDDTGGMYIAFSTLTSLYRRNITGQGQHVDLSQMIIGATLNGSALLDVTVNGRSSRREGYPPGNRAHWPGTPMVNNYRGPTTAPHNAYRTKGGGYNDWCAIACFSDEEWRRLVAVIGSPQWATSPKFATLGGRLQNQEELDRGIQEWCLTLEKYELMERCQAAGVRAMPVQSTENRVEHDPQLRHREMYLEMEHPALGLRKFQNAPFKLSETPALNFKPAPLIGQHNQEIYEGILGLSHQEFVSGYEDGTFWPKTIHRYPYMDDMIKASPMPFIGQGATYQIARPPKEIAAANSGPQPGPLTGLRVLELADEKGQFCGKLMGDLGAEVIKIEPVGGETSRVVGPFLNDIPHRERSLSFWHYNTSKRSVTLNLETEDGRDLFRRLAATADVILETFAAGYLSSLGLGYESLHEVNPRLIMCSLTPFGQTGPWRDFLTSDLLHMAAGGQMGCCGYDKDDVPGEIPIAPGGGNAWHIGSHYAYMAIIAALVHRTNTGRGQYIDASVHDACALTTEMHVNTYIYRGDVVLRQTGRHAAASPTDQAQLRCKDGKYVNASASWVTLRQFPTLVEWMDSYGLAGDLMEDRYQDPAVFSESGPHINDVVANFVAHLTRDEVAHGGQERGFNWGAIRAPDELVDEGHLTDRGFWVEVRHPELGRSFKYPGPAGIYNGSPWLISRRAPLIGEHNEEIYCGELALQRAELAYLAEAGVV